jgi:hypothetical protein
LMNQSEQVAISTSRDFQSRLPCTFMLFQQAG